MTKRYAETTILFIVMINFSFFEALAFMAKFEELGAMTETEALAANPDLTTQSFKQFSAHRRHSLQASVSQFLSVEGCDHAEAKALAAKYAEFREMDLPSP